MDIVLTIRHLELRVLALPTMCLTYQEARPQMVPPYSPTQPGTPFQEIRYGTWIVLSDRCETHNHICAHMVAVKRVTKWFLYAICYSDKQEH